MNNGSTTYTVCAFAVCANRPHLYGQFFAAGSNTADSETAITATCGSGQVVTGGGVYSSGSLSVNLSSTFAFPKAQRRSWENNDTASDVSMQTYAICVGLGAS